MEENALYDTIFGIFVLVAILAIAILIMYKMNNHE